MIAYYAKRSPGEDFQQISAPIEAGCWIDGANLSDQEIDALIERYQLDPNIVYDVRDRSELPRLEFSGEAAYVFIRVPHLAKSGKVSALPMLAVMNGHGTFITMSIGDTVSPESVSLSTLPITSEQTDTLLLGVIAAVVTQFEELIGHTARSITDTANRLKSHDVTNRDFIHFVTVEANLSHCHLNLDSTLAVVRRLRENHHERLTPDSIEALDDVALHIQQLLVSINSHSQSVESIRNAYSTVANNTLNQRMKTLTVFTVLITLPDVFYGMYGMNVALPLADKPWAYPAIVGFTLVLIIVVFAVAKRLRIF